MPHKTKEAKALYDKQRRAEKRAELAAYDAARNQLRRADPAYNQQQIERKREWRANNRERHLAVSRAYDNKQLAENPHRRIAKNLRHRIRKAMRGETRGNSATKLLGISVDEFREYITTKFQPGMSWENYGEWHLDHVHPLKLFDLEDDNQVAIAFHYTNYQPLWALENQKKWCKPHPKTWGSNYDTARGIVGEDA